MIRAIGGKKPSAEARGENVIRRPVEMWFTLEISGMSGCHGRTSFLGSPGRRSARA